MCKDKEAGNPKFLNLMHLPIVFRLQTTDSFDAVDEARAEGICRSGSDCGIYGKCFAKEHGQPESCSNPDYLLHLETKNK